MVKNETFKQDEPKIVCVHCTVVVQLGSGLGQFAPPEQGVCKLCLKRFESRIDSDFSLAS